MPTLLQNSSALTNTAVACGVADSAVAYGLVKNVADYRVADCAAITGRRFRVHEHRKLGVTDLPTRGDGRTRAILSRARIPGTVKFRSGLTYD